MQKKQKHFFLPIARDHYSVKRNQEYCFISAPFGKLAIARYSGEVNLRNMRVLYECFFSVCSIHTLLSTISER